MTAGHAVASTVSRYNLTCIVCSGDILPGDRMFCSARPRATPSEEDGAARGDDGGAPPSASASATAAPVERGVRRGRCRSLTNNQTKACAGLAWGHAACHDPTIPPPPACRHWERLGRCPAREAGECAFRHDVGGGDRGSSSARLDGRQRWGGRRRYVRNQHKNSVFRIFLMRTYGADYVNGGGGGDGGENGGGKRGGVILDVAGGKGELSFELLNLSGAGECVVVDPRSLNLGTVLGKWRKGLFEPRRVGVFSRWYPACEDGCKDREPRRPGHMRCFFDGASFEDFARATGREDVDRTDDLYRRWIDRARRITWTTKGLRHEDGTSYDKEGGGGGGGGETEERTTTETTGIDDPAEARDIVRRCHLVVGLHPDQAAGDIIEFAMAMGVPYCIVPCCVYSDTFAQRKLRDGTKVRTFDHLVEWLCEKDPRAKTAILDLEGKNTVIYTLPDIE